MMTIFTTAKPFIGDASIRQINAIRSWKELHADVEIIIFGNEDGVSRVSTELGIRNIPDVKKNEFGTPLLNDMFQQASKIGKYDLQAYINADIILLCNLSELSRLTNYNNYVIVGQRWDIDFSSPINFGTAEWKGNLLNHVKAHGTLHPPAGSDYFIFPRGLLSNMPSFAVGRIGWDNWVLYNCRDNKIPLINGTELVTAVHLNHDYSHVKNKKSLEKEAECNIKILGNMDHLFRLDAANWRITKGQLKRIYLGGGVIRTLRRFLILHPKLDWIRVVFRKIRSAV